MTPTVRGVGLGLRWEFLDALVESSEGGPLPIDFLEVSPENYLKRGGKYPAALSRLVDQYPIVTHGLTLSLGGSDPLDDGYLSDLSSLVRDVRTPWHSDHLCVGAIDGRAMHELLPVSCKRTNVQRIADRIARARDHLRLPLAIENISYYWHPGRREMSDAEFLADICSAADCSLLLDVNNVYVNALNFGFDLDEWMRSAPLDRVVQIHVAGHEWFSVDERGIRAPCSKGAASGMVIDTHGAEVSVQVMSFLERVIARTGPVPVVLERDQNMPSLDVLVDEILSIRTLVNRAAAPRKA